MTTKTPDEAARTNTDPPKAPDRPILWKEITDTILRFLAIIVSWPVIILALVLLVRDELPGILDELAKRTTAISMAGFEVEFAAVRQEIAEVKETVDTVPTIAAQVDDIQQELVGFRESAALTPDLQAQLTATVTEFSEYLTTVGFDLPSEPPVVEILTDYSGAWYDSTNNVIGIAEELTDDPLYITRQYAHHQLLAARNATLGDLNTASRYLESGLAFYYPASFNDDSHLGGLDLAASGLDDATPVPGTEPFVEGAKWGAAFWEMRTLLGKELSDRVLLEAWSVNEQPGLDQLTPADFVERVLDALPADVDPGDRSQVRQIFERRGFLPPA
jgi:hypothetical protein